MKIYVTSDIHLEFGDCEIPNKDNVNVLILSGDICVAKDIGRPDPRNHMVESQASQVIKNFFQRVSNDYPHVIFVMGNHEHYHGDFAKSYDIFKKMFAELHIYNVYLLEKEVKEIDNWLFIGGTLWTDFNNANLQTMQHAAWGMNDYNGVKNSASGHAHGIWKLIPQATLSDHYRMRDYIKMTLGNRRENGREDSKVVVVGHHAPSRLSTHPRYAHDVLMNGCYSSSLDDYIMDHPEIALWTHGHTHEDFDYTVGETRVVCNPRGYINHEVRADNWTPKLIEFND